MANCNFRQNTQILNFWNLLIKQAKDSETNKIQFLKSLAPVLQKYSFSMQELKKDPETQHRMPLLNSPNFHFLTIDLIGSVFLNYVCQINIMNLLEESELLSKSLSFLYETFGISKDENIKNKIISFGNFIFEKQEFLKKLFFREEDIGKILTRGFFEDNNIIFLTFLNYFNENMLKNDEIDFNIRNRFFQEVRNFLEKMKEKEIDDYQNKIIRFFCIFFQKLIGGKEIINCVEIFQILTNTTFNEDFLAEKV